MYKLFIVDYIKISLYYFNLLYSLNSEYTKLLRREREVSSIYVILLIYYIYLLCLFDYLN